MAEVIAAPLIHRDAVPPELVVPAARLVWKDLLRRGVLPDEVDNYRRTSNWFPWLADAPEIRALIEPVEAKALTPGRACRPQIVVQFPDEYDGEIVPHVDKTDAGEHYLTVVGVALTRSDVTRGGLHWWTEDGVRVVLDPLDPGDIVAFPGTLPHASGANVTADPRISVYLRWA